MKWIRLLAIAIVPVAVLVCLVPANSQVVVVPSKEDRILEKLDRVLANQKEMKASLDRMAKVLEAREKDAGKVAGAGPERREP